MKVKFVKITVRAHSRKHAAEVFELFFAFLNTLSKANAYMMPVNSMKAQFKIKCTESEDYSIVVDAFNHKYPQPERWLEQVDLTESVIESDAPIKNVIGSRIRALRQEKGMSVVKLAELAGTSYPAIVRIENGQQNLGVDLLERIANTLGCHVELVKD